MMKRVILSIVLLAGCKDDEGTPRADAGGGDGGASKLLSSQGAWMAYDNAYGDGRPNPAMGIMGSVDAFDAGGGKTRFKLTVSGLPANRPFGSHLHILACGDNKAGGHYQHMMFPDGGSATDPAFANVDNEVWLDFTTDAMGNGSAERTVNFRPRAGAAKGIMVHDMRTGDGGVAGAKLACVGMPW